MYFFEDKSEGVYVFRLLKNFILLRYLLKIRKVRYVFILFYLKLLFFKKDFVNNYIFNYMVKCKICIIFKNGEFLLS